MDARYAPSPAEVLRLLPEIILIVVATVIMVAEALRGTRDARPLGRVAVGGLLAALWASASVWANPGFGFNNSVVLDGFSAFFRALVIVAGLLAVLLAQQYLRREGVDGGEYYSLILFSVAGQCIMVSGTELIVLFIGLEISSIATYVLAGYLRDDRRANEAAIKYFLLGSFATAFMLYGVAWIYGASGSTNLIQIRRAMSNAATTPSYNLVATAAALILVGLAFKISAAPFQSWAPDVYQGAPAPAAAFMSVGPKAAAFAMLLRIFVTAFEPVSNRWLPVMWISALATMMIGNFAALWQTNIKRLLAYSSVAHAGYVLVAVVANSPSGTAAVMFYMAAYALMNLGAFAVITYFSREGERYLEIDDLAGLGSRQPVTAALFSVLLLSLIGVPLTGGFFAKFYVFKAALEANLVWLTVLGLLTSAVAAYYYLRILVIMYMHEPTESTEHLPPQPAGIRIVLWTAALGTLALGIFPGLILDFANRAAGVAR
jgi:NADH-quinone oxidoreductase subunit N